MQGSGRIFVSTARLTTRLSRIPGTNGVRTFHSKPPPALLASSAGLQRRGYRRTIQSLKEDDDKKNKPGKEVDNQSHGDSSRKKTGDVQSQANDQDSKAEIAAESAKENKSGDTESTGSKEKRSKEPKNQKTPEENVRPGVVSRNQTLSLVTNGGNRSRLIITNHDHPETYPQCMALAMSGRPILPGFYSIHVNGLS